MTILRTIARPLLASVFIYDGADAVINSEAHASKFLGISPALEKLGVPPIIATDARVLAKISGGITTIAGIGLAAGWAPRTNAAILATINLPITLVNTLSNFSDSLLSEGEPGENDQVTTQSADDSPVFQREAVHTFLQGAAVAGGLLLAIFDREGKPSLGWRAKTAEKAAEKKLERAKRQASKKTSEHARSVKKAAQDIF